MSRYNMIQQKIGKQTYARYPQIKIMIFILKSLNKQNLVASPSHLLNGLDQTALYVFQPYFDFAPEAQL